jgi:hypothetical protein
MKQKLMAIVGADPKTESRSSMRSGGRRSGGGSNDEGSFLHRMLRRRFGQAITRSVLSSRHARCRYRLRLRDLLLGVHPRLKDGIIIETMWS